jgi:hypothetical protein
VSALRLKKHTALYICLRASECKGVCMSIWGAPVRARVGAAHEGGGDVVGSGVAFGAPVHDSATAAALAALSKYETDPPPPGGWTAFLDGLVLRIDGNIDRLPDGYYLKDQSLFATDMPVWNPLRTRFWVALEHPQSGARYVISSPVGSPGGFGAVWAFALQASSSGASATTHGFPRQLVVKFYKEVNGIGTIQEVERLERMRAIDAALHAVRPSRPNSMRGDAPTPDRVQTRVLYDRLGAPCMVMPRMSETLPYKKLPVALAMEVIRAVFIDLEDMFTRYQLLSFDLKIQNVLLDVRSGRVRVRASDFGGYGNVGSDVSATFPLPWTLQVRHKVITDADGSAFYVKEMFNVLDEELCVYQIGVLLLLLTSGLTLPNMTHIEFQFLEKRINATTGNVNTTPAIMMWGDALRNPGWTPDALAMLEYVSRYDATRGGLGGTPGKTTMAGLRRLLMPAVDVVDLTSTDGEDEANVSETPKRRR